MQGIGALQILSIHPRDKSQDFLRSGVKSGVYQKPDLYRSISNVYVQDLKGNWQIFTKRREPLS